MTPTFDPEPAGYLYEQMAAHLEARIRAGELRPDRPLPAEQQLANEYGVSLGTARHAVRLLQFRGLVQVIRSKGTYVSRIDALPDAGQSGDSDAEPVSGGSVEGWRWL